MLRFDIIRPHIEDGASLSSISSNTSIPISTLKGWVSKFREDGLAGLVRRRRSDKAKRKLSPILKKLIQGLALKPPKLSSSAIHRKVVEIALGMGERPPGYNTVHRIIQELGCEAVTMAHDGPKAYSETFDIVQRTEANGPNAIWQADHTELDILLRDGNNERKPWLTIIIDDYSRAVMGYAVYFGSPSSIQTALALRHAIWRKSHPAWQVCGIPAILYTDHGTDFTSRHMEQVSVDLKIQLVFSAAGQPRGRGKIERFFQSLSQILLQRLPGYSPPKSRRHAKAALTLGMLAKEIENYLASEYNAKPHTATGAPPQQRWQAGGFLPHMPDSLERLDLLLLTVPRSRMVQRDGIRFEGLRYMDPTLAGFVGEKVMLRYDPRDMGEIRIYFNDKYLCRAVCQELAGLTLSIQEIKRARRNQKKKIRDYIQERTKLVDSLIKARSWGAPTEQDPPDSIDPAVKPTREKPRLKLFRTE